MDSQPSQPQQQQQQPLPYQQPQPQSPPPQAQPQPIQQQQQPAQACTNVVIPIPIVAPEDIYTYVTVKGSLHAQDCSIFGLNQQEVAALTKRFTNNGSVDIVNGIMIKIPPLQAINTLSQLGYKVICTTGEAEICWTMQREL